MSLQLAKLPQAAQSSCHRSPLRSVSERSRKLLRANVSKRAAVASAQPEDCSAVTVARRGVLLAGSVATLSVIGGFTPSAVLPTARAEGGLDLSIYGGKEGAKKILAACKPVFAENIQPGIAGNLLRMAFHDSGTWDGLKKTGGANGSIRFELDQPANAGLAKPGWKVIEKMKKEIDEEAGIPITYADLIQLAAAEAVDRTGGPKIRIELGRKDVDSADPPGQLPAETLDWAGLKDLFGNNGYTTQDVVALSGSHTIGFSQKHNPRGPMTKTFLQFDNGYFKQLLTGDGAFFSDKALVKDPEPLSYVKKYANNQGAFFKDYVAAHEKMSLQGVVV